MRNASSRCFPAVCEEIDRVLRSPDLAGSVCGRAQASAVVWLERFSADDPRCFLWHDAMERAKAVVPEAITRFHGEVEAHREGGGAAELEDLMAALAGHRTMGCFLIFVVPSSSHFTRLLLARGAVSWWAGWVMGKVVPRLSGILEAFAAPLEKALASEHQEVEAGYPRFGARKVLSCVHGGLREAVTSGSGFICQLRYKNVVLPDTLGELKRLEGMPGFPGEDAFSQGPPAGDDTCLLFLWFAGGRRFCALFFLQGSWTL